MESNPDARMEDLGEITLLPGLVNAHTHLELTAYPRSADRPASFVAWVLALRSRIGQAMAGGATQAVAAVEASVRAGIEESQRFGVTCVGDIAFNVSIARRLLSESSMGGVSFGEVLGMAGRAAQRGPMLAAALDRTCEREGFRAGVEPHAPYSLDLDGFRECVAAAAKAGLPICTHLAETADEAGFLADHSGPLRELWSALGAWEAGVSTFPAGPIRAMHDVGLLDPPAVLAHVNYCDDAEMELLASTNCSVVYCPRTHEWFGHPAHRWRDMLAKGINVAVGTDSRTSSPDLNLVEDLRLLHRLAPDVPARLLWEMATVRAARALGMGDRFGALAPGFRADFVAFRIAGDDPLEEILGSNIVPASLWVAGKRQDF